MPVCVTYGEYLIAQEFNWKWLLVGIRYKTCKYCQSKQRKRWYEATKEKHKQSVQKYKNHVIREAQQYVWDYLSIQPCVDCGETNPVVLEFPVNVSQSK